MFWNDFTLMLCAVLGLFRRRKAFCHEPNSNPRSFYIMQSSSHGCYTRQTKLHEDNSSNWVVQVGIRGRLFAVVGSMHENIGKYGFAMIQIATSILLILFYNFYHF